MERVKSYSYESFASLGPEDSARPVSYLVTLSNSGPLLVDTANNVLNRALLHHLNTQLFLFLDPAFNGEIVPYSGRDLKNRHIYL